MYAYVSAHMSLCVHVHMCPCVFVCVHACVGVFVIMFCGQAVLQSVIHLSSSPSP